MLNFERDTMKPEARRLLSDMHWKGECPGEEILRLRQRLTEVEEPQPMSEAPKRGHIRLVYTVVRNAHHDWRKYSEEPDGWLPTTTDEQVGT